MRLKATRLRMKLRFFDSAAMSSLIPYLAKWRTTSANLLGGVSGFFLKKIIKSMLEKEKSPFCALTISSKLWMH